MLNKPRLFFFHNRARLIRNIKRLYYSPKLSRQCKEYARYMGVKNSLVHDWKLEAHILQVYPLASAWGENIGVTPSGRGAQKRLQEAFMASESHKDNILAPYFVRVGMGFYDDGKGMLWCCVRFARA